MESNNNLQKQVGIDNGNSIDNECEEYDGDFLPRFSVDDSSKVDNLEKKDKIETKLIKKEKSPWKLCCCKKIYQ